MFRILQEALTNVVRHAHAGAVRITVRERGRMLTLAIRDNGRGITKTELASVESIGLLGMNERARLLRGRVTIAGSPGRGTTVTVRVPIRPALTVDTPADVSASARKTNVMRRPMGRAIKK
jgi:signal transduction histidine kinase